MREDDLLIESRQKEELFEENTHSLHIALITADIPTLKTIIQGTDPVTLSEELNNLSDNECSFFFSSMTDYQILGAIFSYLNIEKRQFLCENLNRKTILNVLAKVENDDLADFLEDLTKDTRNQILALLPAKRRNIISSLARFSDDCVGSIMTTEYLSIPKEAKVSDAFKKIKEVGKSLGIIRTIFITDNNNILLGIMGIEDLMFEDENTPIVDCMQKDFAYISPISDKEEAIPICQKYDLAVLPVVSEKGYLLGIITFDDVLDVIEEENTEDIYKQAGVTYNNDAPYLETKAFKLARSYVIWLIILLIINTFTGMIISNFETALLTFPILLSFIPALGDSCGDAGDQTASIITRSLATNEISTKDFFKVSGKEFLAGILTALMVSSFSFLWVLLELNTPILNVTEEMEQTFISAFGSVLNGQLVIAGIVAMAFFVGIALAKLFAAMLPMLAKIIHLDPALMSGPLIASIMDIITLLVYFSISMAVIDAIDPGAIVLGGML